MTPLNGFGRRRWSAFAAGALVLVLAACGSQAKTVETKKKVAAPPRKVLLASIRTTAAAESARVGFSATASGLGSEGFAVTGDGVFDLGTGDGQLTMHFGGAAAQLFSGGFEVRTVDGAAYMKMPESLGSEFGGGKWVKTPDLGTATGGVPGAGQADPSQFLTSLEAVSNSVKTVGTEKIRGVDTTHYRATLDLGKALDRTDIPASVRDQLREVFESFGSNTIPADVWVDADGLVRRIAMQIDLASFLDEGGSSTGAAGQAPVVTVALDMYDFGVPVHVVAPPADQLTTIPGLFGPTGTAS